MSGRFPLDPFAAPSDPGAYVPRPSTELALQRLESALRAGAHVQVLSGPPGIGKTLLLHVLAGRLTDAFLTVYLPYASLSWRELCAWILGLLGEPSGANPDRELLAMARASAARGRPLLLLVDEASGLPDESATGLAVLLEEAAGALRALLVPVDDARAGRVLGRVARGVDELRLSAPMNAEETARYVASRLARATPEVRAHFDAETVHALHQASRGIPAEIHRLGTEILRGNTGVLPGEDARRALGEPADRRGDDSTGREDEALEIDGDDDGRDEDALAPIAVLAPPNVPLIVFLNLALALGAAALLWWFGYLPPP